jgi:hypothetical protein
VIIIILGESGRVVIIIILGEKGRRIMIGVQQPRSTTTVGNLTFDN